MEMRPLVHSDLDELLLWSDVRATTRFLEPPTAEWLTFLASSPSAFGFAFEAAGGLVAYAQCDLDGESEASLAICVAPPHRGHGLGVEIITSHLVPWARQQGLTALVAYVEPGNRSALAMCGRAGFMGDEAALDADGMISLRLSLARCAGRS